uniref:Putative exonuclease n=1 Tax=Trypanosoma congolense (strain IL3000) TaxID=1068625 RepID=G0URU4_TRYCI|nr:putative exonuclease [Trypanosoma congolense IL3000]
MGIKGLWSEVKPVCQRSHLSKFRGQRVAVDMYVWLHRGIIGSVELGTEADIEEFRSYAKSLLDSSAAAVEYTVPVNTRMLQCVMSRVDLLLKCGIHPVLVFDGAEIPMKRGKEEERKGNRDKHLIEALALLGNGNAPCTKSVQQEITALLEKGMDITTELAHAVILVLQERRLECIVAPYEADAQLAYLCKQGYVQAVISEDSDLIAYQCPYLIAKLDHQGNCQVISAQDIPRCPKFQRLSYESFLVGCIMSGCDYLPSLRLIGIKKAFALVRQADSVRGLMQILETKFGFAREELREYEPGLQRAFYCFVHHIVYDPRKRKLVTLTPLPAGVPLKENILGDSLHDELAQKICSECLYDPSTRALYKGSYRYCVERYQQQQRGDQALLTSFNGFKNVQSPRVTLRLDMCKTSETPFSGSASGSSLSTTTTLFSKPLQKICEATGFRGEMAVRSKYFTNGRWRVDDWDTDNTQGSSTSSKNENSGPNDTADDGTTDRHEGSFKSSLAESTPFSSVDQLANDVRLCGTSIDHYAQNSGPLDGQMCATTGDPAEALTDDALKDTTRSNTGTPEVLGMSDSAPGRDTPALDGVFSTATEKDIMNSESVTRGAVQTEEKPLCPFGYVQCGRRHSIFEQCYLGKGWSKGRAQFASESSSTSNGEADVGGTCKEPVSLVPRRTGVGLKRWRGTVEDCAQLPLHRPAFKPPASTAKTSGSIFSAQDINTASTQGSLTSCTEADPSPPTVTSVGHVAEGGEEKQSSRDVANGRLSGDMKTTIMFEKLAFSPR